MPSEKRQRVEAQSQSDRSGSEDTREDEDAASGPDSDGADRRAKQAYRNALTEMMNSRGVQADVVAQVLTRLADNSYHTSIESLAKATGVHETSITDSNEILTAVRDDLLQEAKVDTNDKLTAGERTALNAIARGLMKLRGHDGTRTLTTSNTITEEEKGNEFREGILNALSQDRQALSNDKRHRYMCVWLDEDETLSSMYKIRLHQEGEWLISIYPMEGTDEFECHACLDRFSLGTRVKESKKQINPIRQHAASSRHIKALHLARVCVFKALERVAGRFPRLVGSIQDTSPNDTLEEYQELQKRIETGNKWIVQLKKGKGSELQYDPPALDVATPSKFLMFTESHISSLETSSSHASNPTRHLTY